MSATWRIFLLYYFDYKNGVSTWQIVGTIVEKFAERGESTTSNKSVTQLTANTMDKTAHLPTNPSDNTKE